MQRPPKAGPASRARALAHHSGETLAGAHFISPQPRRGGAGREIFHKDATWRRGSAANPGAPCGGHCVAQRAAARSGAQCVLAPLFQGGAWWGHHRPPKHIAPCLAGPLHLARCLEARGNAHCAMCQQAQTCGWGFGPRTSFSGSNAPLSPIPPWGISRFNNPSCPLCAPPPKGRRPPRLAPRGCRAPSGGYLLWPKAAGAPKKPRDCRCSGGATDTDSKRCWGLPFGVVAKYCCCPKSRGLRLRPRVVGVPTWHPEGELGAGPSGQAQSVHPLKAPRRLRISINLGSSP
jgi:hypothetical protein